MNERSGAITIELRDFKKQSLFHAAPLGLLDIEVVANNFSVNTIDGKDEKGKFMKIVLDPLPHKQYSSKKL